MENLFKPLPPDKIYFSIGEVSQILNVNTSLIRYWEKEFPQIHPHKNRNGERSFTIQDIDALKRIYILVKQEGYTLEGAKKIMSDPQTDINKDDILESLHRIKNRLQLLKDKLNHKN